MALEGGECVDDVGAERNVDVLGHEATGARTLVRPVRQVADRLWLALCGW